MNIIRKWLERRTWRKTINIVKLRQYAIAQLGTVGDERIIDQVKNSLAINDQYTVNCIVGFLNFICFKSPRKSGLVRFRLGDDLCNKLAEHGLDIFSYKDLENNSHN